MMARLKGRWPELTSLLCSTPVALPVGIGCRTFGDVGVIRCRVIVCGPDQLCHSASSSVLETTGHHLSLLW